MPMDPQLAAIYGTSDDVEKVAAAETAEELEEQGDLNVAALSDEDAEALAQQLLGEEEAAVEEPSEEEEEQEAAGDEESDEAAVEEPEEEGTAKMSSAAEEAVEEETEEDAEADEEEVVEAEGAEKVAQEKLAEADFLGRVMAHAYHQELRKIAAAEAEAEKTAGDYGEGEKKEHKRIARGAGRFGAAVGSVMGGVAGAASGGSKAARAGKAVAGALGGAAAYGGLSYAASRGSNRVWRAIGGKGKEHKKEAAAEEVQEQEISAFDRLALQRAEQILAEAQAQGEATEKTSAADDAQMAALQEKVEARAWEILEANGFVAEEAAE